MAYFAPYFDGSGLNIPSFVDIQNQLVSRVQNIFGTDIYLDNDSQDMQYIAAIASALYDTMQMAQLVANNQSPQTAVGTGLDSVIKLNGLARQEATYSTCLIACSGTPGVTIPAGVVQDTSGHLWDMPANQTFNDSGVISCIVTCETAGAIPADIGTLQKIATPQYGWYSVTNAVAATPGMAQETDAELRIRQSMSTALPSQSPMDGVLAAVLSVDGVSRAVGYENTASTADSNGIPGHTISIVADGGADKSVADAIYTRKPPGTGTYGTTTITETSAYGFTTPISFYRPTNVQVDVTVTVKQLAGYSDTLTDNILSAVIDYLNSLEIGADVYVSSLWGAALSVQPDTKAPSYAVTGITAARHGGAQTASDITIAFNEAAQGLSANVIVTVVA